MRACLANSRFRPNHSCVAPGVLRRPSGWLVKSKWRSLKSLEVEGPFRQGSRYEVVTSPALIAS